MEALPVKYKLNFVTFLICIHLDCEEKWKSLRLLIYFFNKYIETNLMIYEVGLIRKIPQEFESKFVKIRFIESLCFNRPKYINKMIKDAVTPVVAIWNHDFLPVPKQIFKSASQILNNKVDFSYPFNDSIYESSAQLIEVLIENEIDIDVIGQNENMLRKEYGYYRCKEVVLLNRLSYENSGLENRKVENSSLSGWERERRLEILGFKKYKVNGIIININSSPELRKKIIIGYTKKELLELIRICTLNKRELETEIKSWVQH